MLNLFNIFRLSICDSKKEFNILILKKKKKKKKTQHVSIF